MDIIQSLREGLYRPTRKSVNLYPSSDLVGSERHAQLRLAGAPRLPEPITSALRLETGTMWHRWFNRKFIDQGMPVINEMRLTNWLPEGWSGIADWLIWDIEKRAFCLADLKTIKGEGLKWLRGKPKEEHIWQLSAYYHALKDAKFPLVREFMVIYLPMNNVPKEDINPVILSHNPLPKDLVWNLMQEKWERAKGYLEEAVYENSYVTESLAPTTPRIQKLFRTDSGYDLRLVPHWTSMFCPYDNSLCDCNAQGVTKIGAYKDGEYLPRKGYEEVQPEIFPSL